VADATTTTTAPPRQPDDADLAQLAFIQSVELAAVNVYSAAITSGKIDAKLSPAVTLFKSHHVEHAQALAGSAGKAARNVANKAVMKKFSGMIQQAASQNDVLAVLVQLESALAATHGQLIATLKATDSAATVASIHPTEHRHVAVLARTLGMNPVDYLLGFDADSKLALTPAAYAIEG
jgi:hypothetical protein